MGVDLIEMATKVIAGQACCGISKNKHTEKIMLESRHLNSPSHVSPARIQSWEWKWHRPGEVACFVPRPVRGLSQGDYFEWIQAATEEYPLLNRTVQRQKGAATVHSETPPNGLQPLCNCWHGRLHC